MEASAWFKNPPSFVVCLNFRLCARDPDSEDAADCAEIGHMLLMSKMSRGQRGKQ